MICPRCSSQGADRVLRTTDVGAITFRQRICSCGYRWTTHEVEFTATASLPVRSRVQRPPPMHTANLPVATGSTGGIGGDLPSGQDLGLFPDQTSDPRSKGSEVLSKRRTKAPPAYSDDFERWWTFTGRCHGNKGSAWRAWLGCAGRPPVAELESSWGRYMLSGGPVNGAVQHVSTWLNGRGWETLWQPASARPGANGAARRDVTRGSVSAPPPGTVYPKGEQPL